MSSVVFDSVSPFNVIYGILGATSGINQVYKGAPKNIDAKVSAFLNLTGQTFTDKAVGVVQRTTYFYIGWAYRVADAQDNAELVLAAWVDSFASQFYANRKLQGTVDTADLDFSIAMQPQYQMTAGREFRIYPCLVIAKQTSSWTLPVS